MNPRDRERPSARNRARRGDIGDVDGVEGQNVVICRNFRQSVMQISGKCAEALGSVSTMARGE